MAVNLLELVKGQLTGPIVSQLGGLVGADDKAMHGAIDGAVPTLLAGLMKQGSTETGAAALAGQLDDMDTGFLDNLGSAFGGASGGGGLANIGGGLLKGLFGGSLGSITDILGKASGLASGKLGSLLSMLAPVVFGMLAKQKKLLGLGAGALSKLLLSQKGFLSGLLPAGITSAMGATDLFKSAPAPQAAAATADAGSSLVGKLLPLALIAALSYFGYTKFIAKDNAVEATPPTIEASAVSGQLTGVLDDVTESLGSITDRDSATAAVPALETATESLDAISKSVEGMPAAAGSTIRSVVSGVLPDIQDKVTGLMDLEGVQSVLDPVIGPLMDKLRSF